MMTIRASVAATLLACLSCTGTGSAGTPPVKVVTVEETAKPPVATAQLLDVRTREEWKEGRLEKAKLVPLNEEGFLAKAKAELDPAKPVLVYCRSGGRSARAAEQLRKAGYTVYDLKGGITAWEKAGKPVVK